MPITLDGTTGIAGIAGSAGTPAVQGGDSNTGMFFPAADTIAFAEGGAEVARFDSSRNFLIGKTTSSGSRLEVERTDNDNGIADFKTNNASGDVIIRSSGGFVRLRATGTNEISLLSANAERMRIDSTGAVTIANLAGTGSRAVNASAAGLLSAASDSRLKEEVLEAPLPGLAEVMQLEPRAYKWLDDIEKRGEDAAVEIGFFADQVKDIIPSAAPMGNDGYYGFYDRAVIAALTKAVQEQQALITALETRLSALEAQ